MKHKNIWILALLLLILTVTTASFFLLKKSSNTLPKFKGIEREVISFKNHGHYPLIEKGKYYNLAVKDKKLYLVVIDLEEGKIKNEIVLDDWRIREGVTPLWIYKILPEGNRVYISQRYLDRGMTEEGVVYAADLSSNKKTWTFKGYGPNGLVSFYPSSDKKSLYVSVGTHNNDYIEILNLQSGEAEKITLPGFENLLFANEKVLLTDITETGGNCKKSYHAYKTSDQSPLWNFEKNCFREGYAIVGNALFYIDTIPGKVEGNRLVVRSLTTGEILWKKDFSDATGAPRIASIDSNGNKGYVYLSDFESSSPGNIFSFNLENGEIFQKVPFIINVEQPGGFAYDGKKIVAIEYKRGKESFNSYITMLDMDRGKKVSADLNKLITSQTGGTIWGALSLAGVSNNKAYLMLGKSMEDPKKMGIEAFGSYEQKLFVIE